MNGHKRKSKKTRNLQEKSSIPPRRDPCLFKVALPRIFSLRIFFCSLISFPFCFVFCLKKKKNLFPCSVCVRTRRYIPEAMERETMECGAMGEGQKRNDAKKQT